ncbi:unnamed protein product [Urochloa humidicola]
MGARRPTVPHGRRHGAPRRGRWPRGARGARPRPGRGRPARDLRGGQRLRSLGAPRRRRPGPPARHAVDPVVRAPVRVLPPLHALAAFPDADAPGSVAVALPGLPELEYDDLKPLLVYASGHELWLQMLVADLGQAREAVPPWVFVNTFDELEHAAIEGLRDHFPVIPVGPLIDPDDADRDDGGCTAWLDARPPRSVVFVAFGSLVNNDSDEVAEIAAGLAATGRPFLWVVRDDNRALLSDNALSAACDGRDDRRGKVVPWCAQGRVLAHPAVGCFVTHCGWNSTAEALAGGVPVVASPRWSDQRINARFLVDVHGVGARAPTPLTRDALRERVEEVMGGPEAEAMARRAASLREKARAAVRGGGSSDRGVQAFVDQIRRAGGGH